MLVELLPPPNLFSVSVKVLAKPVERIQQPPSRMARIPLPLIAAHPLQQLLLLGCVPRRLLLLREVLDRHIDLVDLGRRLDLKKAIC